MHIKLFYLVETAAFSPQRFQVLLSFVPHNEGKTYASNTSFYTTYRLYSFISLQKAMKAVQEHF